jgi:hypothetical protein
MQMLSARLTNASTNGGTPNQIKEMTIGSTCTMSKAARPGLAQADNNAMAQIGATMVNRLATSMARFEQMRGG